MPSSTPLVSPTRRMRPKRMFRLLYKRESPVGSPPTGEKDRQIDDIIRGVFIDFDFSPVFSGDNLRARLVASDIYYEIMARSEVEASLDGALFTVSDVQTRWASLISKQVESLLAFQRHYKGLLPKIGRRQN